MSYLWNILIAVDQLGNALLGGNPDETISSRAGKEREKGAVWACWLCRVLDWVDPRHCQSAIEADEE